MKSSRDFRKEAWELSNASLGIGILSVLIYGLITGASAYTAIGAIILTGPLTVGLIRVFTKIYHSEKAEIVDLFDGFGRCFANSLLTWLLVQIYTFLWSLLFIIPGIIKSYSYSMALYIQNDNPELSSSECIERSKRMMDGNKWRLFCLHFSYIGWILLSVLTFGILLIWVVPAMNTAEVAFYEELSRTDSYYDVQ